MGKTPDRDGLEPAGVASGRVLQALGAAFALVLLAFIVVTVTWRLQVRGPVQSPPRPFPRPTLETTTQPRATEARERGPEPYSERPLAARAGEPDAPSPALAAAMRAVAARGSAAFDPLPGAGP